jgi:hypothetical protein
MRGSEYEADGHWVVLRPSTRSERLCEALWLAFGLVYSLGFYAASGIVLWRAIGGYFR